jgi:hypothetical protein
MELTHATGSPNVTWQLLHCLRCGRHRRQLAIGWWRPVNPALAYYYGELLERFEDEIADFLPARNADINEAPPSCCGKLVLVGESPTGARVARRVETNRGVPFRVALHRV